MEVNVSMSFNPSIAKELDTDSAIIYQNIKFWCAKNKSNNKNFHDEKYWTYNSVSAWEELFTWLTYSQIRRCLSKLEKAGYIGTGCYNSSSYDRTKWYCDNKHLQLSKLTNGSVENDEPIPDINTYKKPDINNNIPQTVFSDQVNLTYNRLEKLFNGIYHPNNQKTADKRLKTTEKWKDCIDKLNRIDGHSFETIEKVITWVKNDDFWKDKFLTLVKARQIKDDIMRFDYWKDKMDREKPQRKEIKKPRIVF